MEPKRLPKCFVGTVANDLGTSLATSSWVLGLKDTFTVPPEAYFDLIWRPTGAHFLTLRAALTSYCEGNFVNKAQCTPRIRRLIVHNLSIGIVCLLIVHHSIAKVTESPAVDVTSFQPHPYKIQQHTYNCEQTHAQRINDSQARYPCYE